MIDSESKASTGLAPSATKERTMNTNTTATIGTVKVGRWVYPAVRSEISGVVTRNTKRDGSGESVELDAKAAAAFVPDEAPAALTGVVAPAAELPIALADASPDYRALLAVHEAIFNSGIWADGSDLQVEVDGANLTEKRGHELARYLGKVGLVVRETSTASDGFQTGVAIYSSTPNWDEVDWDGSLAAFREVVPTDVKVASRTIASAPVNNTHKKPGRSNWQAGSKCPQGIHTLTSANIYTMPSGRKQCKDCRAGYPSNI